MNGLCKLLCYLLNKSFADNILLSHHHSCTQLITNLTRVFAGFLYPTMHWTRANPSRKWLQNQSKTRVKNPRLGMGVAFLLNNRPFPSAQNRAKPGSVKSALVVFTSSLTSHEKLDSTPNFASAHLFLCLSYLHFMMICLFFTFTGISCHRLQSINNHCSSRAIDCFLDPIF